MMRIRMVLAMLLAAGQAVAQGSDAATRRAQEEAQRYFQVCMEGELKQHCEQNRNRFLRDYQAAKAGDYQGQRNVSAYLAQPNGPVLSAGFVGIMGNMLQSCAWALVTLHSGHARADESDVRYVRMRCGHPNVDRAAAEVRAEAIMAEIRRAPARMPPERRTVRPSGPLITTAPDPNDTD